jgi:hypothetical protein
MAFSYPIFSIVPCCSDLGEQLDNFRELVGFQPMFDELPGTFIYEGPTQTLNGIQFKTGYCYTVTQVGFGLVTGFGFNFSLFNQTPIENCESSECTSCELPACYELTKCGETTPSIVSNSSTLLQFYENNKVVKLAGYEGCYTINPIEILPSDCTCLNVTINTNEGPTTYQANAIDVYNGLNLYLFNDGISNYYVWFDGKSWVISKNGYELDILREDIATAVDVTVECPDSIANDFSWTILSNDNESELEVVPEFPQNSISSITTEVCSTPSACDCAVSVTVTQSYDDCEDCLPIVAYKFTNCDNPSLIQYSTSDYSAYVGKTVELECGGCWIVSEINITPPSTQNPVIQYVFDNCAACKANYYKLTNCTNSEQVIYTSSQLSLPVSSPVITIKECSGCFIVEETRLPINPISVTQLEAYSNCEECLPPPPPAPEPEPLPKKFIKPGYLVPACDVEKYEKFACKSSEILYKQVLEKRYGITNCCPEGEYDQRWIIKKELADLQGLMDPNYNCTPVDTCCNKAPSCNCH